MSKMRKALVVGIDHYDNFAPLNGCVNDAVAVQAMLARHANGTVNFEVKLLAAADEDTALERNKLREAIQELFKGDSEIALLYFAGHGHIEEVGGFICAGDCETGNDGVSLSEIVFWANESTADNMIIVLDSCFSGIAGAGPAASPLTRLSVGMTILTASTADQYADEQNSSGIFTNLFVDALNGAAANLLGDVTPSAVYAHIDQSLGAWAQRPVFKTNVEAFVSLRKVEPPIPLADLQRLAEFFPTANHEFQLDPAYEPERAEPADEEKLVKPDPAKNAVFAILQKFNRDNLVVPVHAPHMWHAAMESKACKLTALGKHYHSLVKKGLL